MFCIVLLGWQSDFFVDEPPMPAALQRFDTAQLRAAVYQTPPKKLLYSEQMPAHAFPEWVW